MRRTLQLIQLALVALVIGAPIASASPITLPSGLNLGDVYFLAFSTSGYMEPTSSNILDYDLFVSL